MGGLIISLEVYSIGWVVTVMSLFCDVVVPWSNVFTVFAHPFC